LILRFDSTVSSFLYPQLKNRTYSFGLDKRIINLFEDGDNFTLKPDFPDVDPSELQIQLEQYDLEIEVSNKKPMLDEEVVNLLINDWLNTHMKRTIELSKPVDSDKAKSRYKNGIMETLCLNLRKHESKLDL
tara:strand:- start:1243 stop:1638 length:396 start_codon:yes stop_codon:yes gene_type:complete